MRKILPSITTHGTTSISWKDRISEIEPLGLRDVGLFLTGLTADQRYECYNLLRKVRRHHSFSVPFVHAVSSMNEDEYNFLIDIFDTKAFNLHPTSQYPLDQNLSANLREKIYIENASVEHALTPADIEGFAGICLDLSHLEEMRLNDIDAYRKMETMLGSNKIGANHLSAIWYKTTVILSGRRRYSQHVLRTGRDLIYLKGYPANYFSRYCAIELENSLAEQARLIHVLEQLLADKNSTEHIKEAA
jgi:hypothetical protein